VQQGFAVWREAFVFSGQTFRFEPASHPWRSERKYPMFDLDGEARERLIVWIRRRMEEYGITLEDLETAIAESERQPKYRDAYGNTWNGEGEMPPWLLRAIHAGQDIEHFRS
jgi:DNA-binding protein H-NS